MIFEPDGIVISLCYGLKTAVFIYLCEPVIVCCKEVEKYIEKNLIILVFGITFDELIIVILVFVKTAVDRIIINPFQIRK